MNEEQEKKWREEFRTLKNKQVAKYVSDHALDTIYMDDLEIYLAARKAAQVELDAKDKVIKHRQSKYFSCYEKLKDRDQEISKLKTEIDLLTKARDEWRVYTFDERGKLKSLKQEIERLKKVMKCECWNVVKYAEDHDYVGQLKERDELIKEAIPLIESKIYTIANEEWLEKARKLAEEKCFY